MVIAETITNGLFHERGILLVQQPVLFVYKDSFLYEAGDDDYKETAFCLAVIPSGISLPGRK